MNASSNFSSRDQDNKKQLYQQFDQSQLADFQLTYDQYIILQNLLPKKFALLEVKTSTVGRKQNNNSAIKNSIVTQDKQNISRISGNADNQSEFDIKSKRSRIKKVDRYLDQDQIKQQPKRGISEKIQLNDEMVQCLSILNNLKKHRSAMIFLLPVDPKQDGCLNYFDVIKDPMDFSTIQKKIKLGQYQSSSQFHADISKIWFNSYTYNDKTSPIHKMTVEIQKYYKNLLSYDNILSKAPSQKSQKSKIKERKVQEKNLKLQQPKPMEKMESEKDEALEEIDFSQFG